MKLKKLISVFVALAMIMSMAAMVYAVPDFDDTLDFTLESGDEGYPGTSGEGWTWDLATKTLTIDGLDLYTSEVAVLLPADSNIVIVESSVNTIKSEYGEGIKIYGGDLDITGGGSLWIDSDNSAIRATGNLTVSGLTELKIDSGGKGLNVGPGKNNSIGTLIAEEPPLDVEDNYDGNITITDTVAVIINSVESGFRAVGSLIIDNVDTIEIVITDSGTGSAGIRVGGGSNNYNQNDGDATITNVGSLSVESYHTSIRVMGDLYFENVDYVNLVSQGHTGIRVGRGDEDIDTDSLGNVEIVNCGELWIDADHTGIRVTGDLIIDIIDILDIIADHMGIRAGSSYYQYENNYEWSQSEAEGLVHIKNAENFNIEFGYTGIRSNSDIWIYQSRDVDIVQNFDYNSIRSLDMYVPEGYGLYSSAGDITIERSDVMVGANTYGIVTGSACRENYYEQYSTIQGEVYDVLDIMIGGDVNIIQSFVISEVPEVGRAAIAAGNGSSMDITERKIIIQKAMIAEPEDGVVLDVDITFITPSMVIDYPEIFIDQSITWNTEISLIESFDDMAKVVVIVPLFAVTYDANTGTGTMEDANSPYFYEDSVEVMANSFSKEGYEFVGFNTAADGSGTDYQSGDTFTIEGYDVVLYAQYDINVYTVNFNDFDDTLIDTDSVEHGGNATAPADPEREGYTFTGWDKGLENIVENTTITATYELDIEYIEELVKKAEETKDQNDVDKAREWVNILEEGEIKGDFDERLDDVQDLIDETPEPGDRFPLSSVILLLLLSAAVVVFATRKQYTAENC